MVFASTAVPRRKKHTENPAISSYLTLPPPPSKLSLSLFLLGFPFVLALTFRVRPRRAPLPSHTIARLLRRRYAHTHGSAHWRLTIHRSHLSSLFPLSFLFRRTADGAIHGGGILPQKREGMSVTHLCDAAGIRPAFSSFLIAPGFFKEGGRMGRSPNHQRRM